MLKEELSLEQKAILKFCDWVNTDYASAGNLVVELNGQTSPTRKEQIHLDYRVVLSDLGTVVLGKTRDTNGHPHLQYALVATSELFGLYSPSQQRKLVMSSSRLPFTPLVQFMPSGSPESKSPFGTTIGLSLWNRESPKPQWLGIRMAPVAALAALADAHSTSIDNGVLTVKQRGTESGPEDELELKVHAASGRLINLQLTITGDLILIENGKFVLRVHPQTGAFAQALGEIDALTEDYPNAFAQTNRIGSTLAFLGTDVLGSDLLKRALDDASVPDSQRQMVRLLQKVDLAKLLAPLDSLWDFLSPFQGETTTGEPFVVPDDAAPATPESPRLGMPVSIDSATLVNMLRFAVLQVFRKTDSLWPWGSWPWTFTREATLNLVNEGRYTPAEIQRLIRSDNLGPLGSLAGESFLGGFDATPVEALALQGLAKLSPGDLEKDVATLLQRDSVGSRLLVNVLSVLCTLSDSEVEALAPLLSPDLTAFLRESVQRLRGAPKDQPPVETLKPAIAQHWSKLLAPYLQRHFFEGLVNPSVRLADQGYLAEAEARQRDLLAKVKAGSAPSNTTEARLLHELGVVLLNQGKLEPAEQPLRQALSLGAALDTSDHHPWVGSLQYLALALRQQGKWAELDSLYREKVAALKQPHGHTCRALTLLLNQWGAVLLLQGKAAEAEPLLNEALALQKTLSGETNLDLVLPLASLAVAQWMQNKQIEARKYADEVCALFDRISGADHPDSIAWRRLRSAMSESETKSAPPNATGEPRLVPGLVALVDGRPILQSEVRRRVAYYDQLLRAQYEKQPQKLSAELARVIQEMIDQLVEEELICSEFLRQRHASPTNSVQTRIEAVIRTGYGNDRQAFLQSLSAGGETEEAFRKRMEKECIVSDTRRAFLLEVASREPSSESIEEYYRNHTADFQRKESVALSLIVIPANPSDTNAPAGSQRKLAEEIRARSVAGENFASLAKAHSRGSRAKDGGDWGWVERGVLRKELEDVAFVLSQGQISQVLEVEGECYILQVRGRRPGRLAPLSEVREDIVEILGTQALTASQQRWFHQLQSQSVVCR